MKNHISKLAAVFFLLGALALQTSCSVAMAAKKEGTDVHAVKACMTRSQLISKGGELISTDKNENGEIVEVYRFQKPRGSAVRALMHGLLDVSTLGVWEVVGTPIEATIENKEFYTIKAFIGNDDKVTKIELM